MAHPQAIVAVLAGGRAERLGGAKATAPLAGRPLLCHPLAAAREAGLEAIVVAKPATALPELDARVLREPEVPSHPLCGVLTALDFAARRDPAQAIVLLGCDMPFVTAALLSWLALLDGRAICELDGRPQPLPSRWLAGDRVALAGALASAAPLTAALLALTPRILGEPELARFGEPRRLCFNVNTAEDLREAESLVPSARLLASSASAAEPARLRGRVGIGIGIGADLLGKRAQLGE